MRKLEIKLSLATLHDSQPIPSPVTPLRFKSFSFSSSGSESLSSPAAVAEEEKAIAENGFYLHLSPLSTKLLVKIRASWIDKADALSPTYQFHRLTDEGGGGHDGIGGTSEQGRMGPPNVPGNQEIPHP
ncbi:hypothetical protein C1H46_043470 [Malus baccata]|uniref:Uncharacterized protein n=1 Tax=Malus baccata TaxID=106549 RepID=A0A540KA00_MALBA|nr:hypothetical protein C1H46_043470 [Malus baccata]